MTLPHVEITRYEFKQLLEYSWSVPTGVRIGKRWRRRSGRWWLLGEYALNSAGQVVIRWSELSVMDPELEARIYGPLAPRRRRPRRIAKRIAKRGDRMRFPRRAR